MSEGERWVDELMAPIATLHPTPDVYNPIYSAVAAAGRESGKRLVQAIVKLTTIGNKETKR
jgi:hypothetical protein